FRTRGWPVRLTGPLLLTAHVLYVLCHIGMILLISCGVRRNNSTLTDGKTRLRAWKFGLKKKHSLISLAMPPQSMTCRFLHAKVIPANPKCGGQRNGF